MKKILNDEDLKEKSKDLYDLLNDFKEELKDCKNKEEKHQLYLTYLDEFKSIVRDFKEDDYIYKYSVDAVNWVKTRLMELYTGYKLQDSKKINLSELSREIIEHNLAEQFSGKDIEEMIENQNEFIWDKLVRHDHSEIFDNEDTMRNFCSKYKDRVFKSLKKLFDEEYKDMFIEDTNADDENVDENDNSVEQTYNFEKIEEEN